MESKTPKITIKDKKGNKTSVGKGVKNMRPGETRTFRISIELPDDEPPSKKK